VHFTTDFIEAIGLAHPATFVVLFIAASLFMIWRLEALGDHGLEGTALGTLITPYCSGLGNLIFVYLIIRDNGDGREVMTNCLVNNVTNLTLVLGIPALFWALEIIPSAAKSKTAKKKTRSKAAERIETQQRLSRLSLLLTMTAVAFFTGAVWALGEDGTLDASDGLVLVGMFLFWQCFQVFDVLKQNVKQKRTFGLWFYIDIAALIAGSLVLYESLDWLVQWMNSQHSGYVSSANLGWLSGWLMVLPNAVLAIYYAAQGRADVVYASQVGDGHICIPLCVGLYALAKPLTMPAFFQTSMIILGGALAVHFFCLLVVGRLPKWLGAILVAAYCYFVYDGTLK
jgi:cation:H+ antiporter